MSRFSATKFKELKDAFLRVTKRVLKKEISKNPEKIAEYKRDLKDTYNAIVIYIGENYSSLHVDNKDIIRKEITFIRYKLLRCFGKLGCNSELSENLLREISGDFEDEDLGNGSDLEETEENMTTQIDMLRLYAQTINKNYAGDHLGLQSFVNSIELLKLMTSDANTNILKQFILSKLEGKALESVPTNPGTIDDIVNALKQSLKPDNSKVIAGKMMALRTDKHTLQDYTKQAEDLADALRRSLIVEGIPQEKAKELVIEQTVEMCRESAKTDLVKSIIASTSFADPKEVVARLIIETGKESKGKQVLAFRSNQNNGNYYRKRGNFNRNNNPRYRSNYSNNNANRQFNRSYNNNNFRGNRRTNYNNDRRRSNNQNDRNIRFAENSDAPSHDGRGMNQNQSDRHVQNQAQYTV